MNKSNKRETKLNTFMQVLKENNNDVFKKYRVELLASYDTFEISEIMEENEKNKNTIIDLIEDCDEDNFYEIMEYIEEYIELDDDDKEILEILEDRYDRRDAMGIFKNKEFHIWESAAEYAENWIENCCGRDGIEGILEKHLGSYLASKIAWNIDMQDIGDDMVRDGEGVYELNDGRILEIYP